MKKAIRISGIIWGVFVALGALVVLILAGGSGAVKDEVINQTMSNTAGLTREQAELAFDILITVLFVAGGLMVAGAVFSFVLVGLAGSSMGKGAGIFVGILGIVLAAELPGILFIVDSAKNRS